MAKKEKNPQPAQEEKESVTPAEETPAPEQAPAEPEAPQTDWQKKYEQEHDAYLRVYADYDNYRKRTTREKEQSYTNGKSDAVGKLLPVYDNLERALKQDTADEAFKKGVEMTMNQLKEVLTKLGITEIPAQGQPFDPKYHNAVMHVEDESLGQNVVAEVFQTGFQCGEKVIRFAMVKVAN